ncbi:MAG: hypothetical protein APR53_03380 [Methanoculleus sp. SDB]|nr:MAG: hypothetical protein APR53_03380 [Methanoculleus sp. SDB]
MPFALGLEELFGTVLQRIEIGDELQKTAKECRQEYIDYIGRLSESHDLNWWLTSASEKNPFISNIFLYFCYVKICMRCMERFDDDLLIVCESPALMRSLQKNLENFPCTVECIFQPFYSVVNAVKSWTERIRNKLWFLIRYTGRKMVAQYYLLKKSRFHSGENDREYVAIHSWADGRSFTRTDTYQEVYFGNLRDELEKKGCNVLYLVHVLPTLAYLQAVRELLRRDYDGVLFEEFYSYADIMRVLVTLSANYPCPQSIPPFMGLDVCAIVAHECTKDRITTRAEQSYLCYFAGRNLCRDFRIHTFTYIFENHMWEKMFCAGIKDAGGQTRTVGYQHSGVISMFTCYAVSKFEAEWMPLPDLIVASGSAAREQLIASGFNPKSIVVGGALRYSHLTEEMPSSHRGAGNTILVALSASLNSSMELTYKALLAFGSAGDLSIIIKAHPIAPFEKIAQFLPPFPEHFHLSDKPINVLLRSADLVLYSESTVCVEALAHNIPIIHIKSDFKIDLNLLEEVAWVPSLSSPEEIRATSRNSLQNDTISSEKARELVRRIFSPVKSEIASFFMKDGCKREEFSLRTIE